MDLNTVTFSCFGGDVTRSFWTLLYLSPFLSLGQYRTRRGSGKQAHPEVRLQQTQASWCDHVSPYQLTASGKEYKVFVICTLVKKAKPAGWAVAQWYRSSLALDWFPRIPLPTHKIRPATERAVSFYYRMLLFCIFY